MARRTLAALAFALLLVGCDAGHRDAPGIDNRWTGPELDIQLPGPETTLTLDLDEAAWMEWQAGRGKAPQAAVHLRALHHFDDLVVRYALDGGPFQTVPDARRPFQLPAGLTAGPHVLQAYVAQKDDGTPDLDPQARRFGPRSVAVARFHIVVKVRYDDGTVRTFAGPEDATAELPDVLVDRQGDTVWMLAVGGALSSPDRVITWRSGSFTDTLTEGFGGSVKLEDPNADFQALLLVKD